MTDPDSQAGSLSDDIDNELCSGLNQLLKKNNITTTDACWLQATLSAKHGGLGINSPKIHQPGAYLASLINCMQELSRQIALINSSDHNNNSNAYKNKVLEPALHQLRTKAERAHNIVLQHSIIGGTELQSLDDLIAEAGLKLQKRLTTHVSQRYYKELWDSSTTAVRIRIDSCAEQGAYWVTTLPTHEHFKMPPEDFTERVCMRLGLPISYIREGKCTECANGFVAKNDGYHLLSGCTMCSFQRIATHNAIRDTWNEFGIHAGLRCSTEPTSVIRTIDPNSGLRLDNQFEGYDGAMPLLGDVSVTDPRQLIDEDYKDGTMRDYAPGTQALHVEKEKIKKYRLLIPVDKSQKLCEFLPLITESYGRWGADSVKLFKNLLHRAHITTGISKSYLSSYWKARLSFALHKTASMHLRKRAQRQDVRAQEALNQLESVKWQVVSRSK